MRKALPWLLLLAAAPALVAPALAAPEAAGGPETASQALTLRFELLGSAVGIPGGGDAFVDLGTLSADRDAGRGRGIVVRRRVAVRLEGGPGAPAVARLSVALATATPGVTVRVDGVTLSTLPRTIDPVHRVGAPVVHEIEVTIPASVPPGTLLSDLHWVAESE